MTSQFFFQPQHSTFMYSTNHAYLLVEAKDAEPVVYMQC